MPIMFLISMMQQFTLTPPPKQPHKKPQPHHLPSGGAQMLKPQRPPTNPCPIDHHGVHPSPPISHQTPLPLPLVTALVCLCHLQPHPQPQHSDLEHHIEGPCGSQPPQRCNFGIFEHGEGRPKCAPDRFTFPSLLKACAHYSMAFNEGRAPSRPSFETGFGL